MTVSHHVLDAHRRLAAIAGGVTDDQVREPSALPGWTRGHVLAHLAGVTAALARQAEYAVKGEKAEVYPGGRPARAADIEANSGRSAREHREALAAAVERLTVAWDRVDDWTLPVTYRDGTLADTASALWREVEIHTRDLDLGPVRWSPEFCARTLEFLSPRVPRGVRLTLSATDGGEWTFGEGEPVVLAGALEDLTAWLAGREPAGALTGEPPVLDPWP